jgi:hypothetical protein
MYYLDLTPNRHKTLGYNLTRTSVVLTGSISQSTKSCVRRRLIRVETDMHQELQLATQYTIQDIAKPQLGILTHINPSSHHQI